MALNKEMLIRLRESLGVDKTCVSRFGVDLNASYYNKVQFCNDEIEVKACRINNEIKQLEVLEKSLNSSNNRKHQVVLMNHNKKIQRTRKARR